MYSGARCQSKDNSIASNCHVHIYFTPNLDSGAATAESISKNLGKKTIKTVSHSDGGGLGKGSNSESFTGRELMTPDEVSHMSSERELVFVAGHRPIYGNKLRYYLQPFFTERLKKYQEIYIKEHGYEKACAKFNHDCERCVKEYKEKQGKVAIACPSYPLYSDSVTKVLSYEDLFKVNAGEKLEREEKARAVRLEKEYEERKINSQKKSEEQISNENTESVEENGTNAESEKQNSDGFEVEEEIGTDRNAMDEQFGESAPEEKQQEVITLNLEMLNSRKAIFGESLLSLKEYEESWEKYINGN